MTKTKIIATLGPASASGEVILALVKAGADVFQLNMSHGDSETHRKLIRTVRSLTKRSGVGPAAIIGDLSGPKIRVGLLEGGRAELVPGAKVTLTEREITGGPEAFHVGYKGLSKQVEKGMAVLMDDGMLELKVVSVMRGEVGCRVVKGGVLKEHKGVNIPGMPLKLPSLTPKDLSDLEMLVREGVDYVALSFVREPGDVLALRKRMRRVGGGNPIIAKVERPEALRNVHDIIEVSDAVMVARGDLGVEMPPELVPPIQKRLIRLCNQLGKPVITATQMLESMTRNPRPTRAEASDVAGAVFDGTDAIMLSEETAAGGYPVAAVTMMNKIAREAERHQKDAHYERELITGGLEAVAVSACRAADALRARAIISFTRTGRTALLLSKYRPSTKVIAATPHSPAGRRMRLYYGVIPVMVSLRPDTDSMLREGERAALSMGLVKKGDTAIVTLGVPS